MTLSLLPAHAQGQGESSSSAELSYQSASTHVAFVGGRMPFGDLSLEICLHCLRQWGFRVEGLKRSEGQYKSCLRPTEHPVSEVLCLCFARHKEKIKVVFCPWPVL